MQRGIAIGTVGVFVATGMGAFSAQPAYAGSSGKKWLTIGAAAITGYGLLTHRRSLAAAGAVGTYFAYRSYRKARKREKAEAAARRAYYYHPYRYSSYSPARYSSGSSYHRTHHYYSSGTHHAYPYHAALHRAPVYPYHAALHPARYSAVSDARWQNPQTAAWHQQQLKAQQLKQQQLQQQAQHRAALTAAAAVPATSALATNANGAAVRPVSAPGTLYATGTTNPANDATASGGIHPFSFMAGFLLALVAACIGFLASHLQRNRGVVRTTRDDHLPRAT
jgi:hypothetical protein